jgi:hypothetical protein
MSKKRKGMSADEKQVTIRKIYEDKCEPFNLKEMESLASKAGVVLQTVKDVNQSLIDDGLVNTDKIGAANIFWSFPGKTFKDQQVLCEKLESESVKIAKNCETLQTSIETARVERSSSDRSTNLSLYSELQEESKGLDKQLQVYNTHIVIVSMFI